MQAIHVQFSDPNEESISAYFSAPQDSSAYPNQGEIYASDARWKAYWDALPLVMQSALPAPEASSA